MGTRKQRVDNLLELAAADMIMAKNACGKGRLSINAQALFHGQQAIEKVMKAFLEARDGGYPFTHKLDELAARMGLRLTKAQTDSLRDIYEFNQKCRYNDSSLAFLRQCTDSFTALAFDEIKLWYAQLKRVAVQERAKIPNGTK